ERYRAIAAAGGWPMVPGTAKLSLGAVGPEVALLRQRLAASGDLPSTADAAAPEVFDAALDAAVRAFQARHGLEVDGVVGPRTRAALNVSVQDRLATMAINLERLRRLAPWLEPDYALVNIPAAEFRLVEAGRTVMQQRAIVGRPDRPTPELDSAVTRIELNPYWNVPPRIARLDIVPKIRRDPGYLAREGIRVLGPDGEVDPAGIDWSGPAATRYRLRQDPGPRNALGVVKFRIPNSFDVYLHDTPSKALFQRSERFFSSGCIRLERPLELARHLLRSDPAWSGDALDRASALGHVVIELPKPMPIHLVYLTAWVDESGTVQFRRDVYGRDVPHALAARTGRACGGAGVG
ncbi:MAG: L,D-transpeptidase family protein, partial [Rhodospirillaceae bacterium]|nr:L,D-transpeptidase family protein [Rhodospirillaceae bacterium]